MPHHEPRLQDAVLTRRELLCRAGNGFGALALGSLLAESGFLGSPAAAADQAAAGFAPSAVGSVNPLAPKGSPLPARARRVVHLFMNGGPSHVDTFDPKPMLTKHHGKPVARQPAHRAQDRRGVSISLSIPEVRSKRHRGQRDLRPHGRDDRRDLRDPLDARRRAQP